MNGKNKILKSGATLLSVVLLLVSVDSAGARDRNSGRAGAAKLGSRAGRASSRFGGVSSDAGRTVSRAGRVSSRVGKESICEAPVSEGRSREETKIRSSISAKTASEERGNSWRKNAGIPERHSLAKEVGQDRGTNLSAISSGKPDRDDDRRGRSGHKSGQSASRRSHEGRSDRYGIRKGTSHHSNHNESSHWRLGLGYYWGDYGYRRWISGSYVTRLEEVLSEPAHYEWQVQDVEVEPGRYELREMPAEEETVYDSQGEAHTIVVSPARTEAVWIPPRYEQHRVRVWVSDRFETQEVRVWVPGRWAYVSRYYPARPHYGLSIGGVFRF